MTHRWNSASYSINVTTSDSLCCEGNITLHYHVQHIALHCIMVIYYTLTDFPNSASTQDGHKIQKRDYM